MIRRHILLLAFAGLGIVLLLVSTSPEKLPAAVFIGLFMLLYGFCYAVLALCGLILHKASIITWSVRRVYRTALAVACLPIFLLILQSIGQLTVKDILLTSGLSVLLYLYFGRLFIKNPAE